MKRLVTARERRLRSEKTKRRYQRARWMTFSAHDPIARQCWFNALGVHVGMPCTFCEGFAAERGTRWKMPRMRGVEATRKYFKTLMWPPEARAAKMTWKNASTIAKVPLQTDGYYQVISHPYINSEVVVDMRREPRSRYLRKGPWPWQEKKMGIRGRKRAR